MMDNDHIPVEEEEEDDDNDSYYSFQNHLRIQINYL